MSKSRPDHIDDHAPLVSAPKPKFVQDDLRGIFVSMRDLGSTYPEAFDVAHSRSVRGESTGTTALWESDPTGNVSLATRQRYLRKALKEASELVKNAEADLRLAKKKIKDAVEWDGVNVYVDSVRVIKAQRSGEIPPPMHESELTALQQAQRSRRERGEA